MKVDSSLKTETTELKTTTDKDKLDEECLSTCDDSFKNLLMQNPVPIPIELSNSTQISGISDSSLSSTSLLTGSAIKSDFNYDSFTMDKDDAMFFVDMANNSGQFALNMQGDVNASVMQLDSATEITSYKSANVSKTLTNLIDDAYTNQKPVRIDFDNNVSVIMRVDKSGKLSAEFIPGDKAVEQYLKNNISFLKQRFDDLELPYNDLTYRQNKEQQQNKKKDKGE